MAKPSAHASSHKRGGTDTLRLDALGQPIDTIDLNANTLRHGLLRKLSGDQTDVLRGDGSFGKATRFIVLTADPVAPADDTGWLVREGSSPQQAFLRIRVAGVTYQLAAMDLI